MKLRRNARTDVGRTRDHNEDNYGIGEGGQVERLGELLIVCDGMGGHASGEVASELAVATILDTYYADEADDRPAVLERAFVAANAKVYAQGRGSMGTTGVAAVLHHDALHIANVGDSRAYLIRGGNIRQLSRDHSFVSDQVAAGLLTPEQARTSQHKNIITRALGYQPDVTVDLFRWPLQVGDLVLLSSDGLHGLVTDHELAQIATTEPLEQAVDHLVTLANERGGTDNITVVLAQVEELDWVSQPITETLAVDTETEEREYITNPNVTRQITDRLIPPASAPVASPAPVVAAPPQERRLSLLGGLLATLLMAALLFTILFFYLNPASTDTTGQTASPLAPTAQITGGTALATAVSTAPAQATPQPQATAGSAATAAPLSPTRVP